jgi:hypothetical protein
MPLNTTGTLSIGGTTVGQSINLELGRTATQSSNLNETPLRTLAGVASGQISISNFYGKANDITSQYGLYLGSGWGVDFITFNSRKYGYSTGLSVATTSVPTARTSSARAVTSTSTFAFMGGGVEGYYIATTTRFTFSNNSYTNSTNLNRVHSAGSAIGNATQAVFGHSQLSSINLYTNTTSIYTYSTNSCVSGTNLTDTDYFCTGTNNSTYGYFFSSYTGTNKLDRWNLTNNTKTVGYHYIGAYFAASTSTTTDAYISHYNSHGRYTYSNNAFVNRNALPNSPQGHSGAGNGTIGCYASSTNILQYTYSSDTSITVSNVFPYSADGTGAASNPPGSF